ncbi:hypothetical protein JL720_6326 [Aureococcus anophagefferens]|nr:hypothetical protein JL720_6326 [Aureococcus anophagefferens]
MAAAPAPRVLSLLSASTEIVCRLGMAHALVGRSHGCDAPPAVLALPAVTSPKMDPTAPSEEIDAAVRAVVAGGGPVYEIRNRVVAALAPDVILTQDQCRICAVTRADVAGACADLPASTIVTIEPTTLGDVLGDVATIARRWRARARRAARRVDGAAPGRRARGDGPVSSRDGLPP